MKSNRNRGKQEILHPIFIECRDSVSNGFWKTLFDDFAHGKCPKQLYITQHGQIQSSNRQDYFQYTFKHKTAEEIIPELQEVLLTHTNLISNEEIDVKKLENLKFKKDTWNQWKDVKKKYVRTILIMDYCYELKQKHSYTLESVLMLYHTLDWLISNGDISDIDMKDNKIDCIRNVTIFADGQIQIRCNTENTKQQTVFEAPDYMYHYCKRYLLRRAMSISDGNEEANPSEKEKWNNPRKKIPKMTWFGAPVWYWRSWTWHTDCQQSRLERHCF